MGKSFLLVVDAHSKWPEVVEVKSTIAEKTIEVLRQLFASYGLPEQAVLDDRPQFTADKFGEFLASNTFIVNHTIPLPMDFWNTLIMRAGESEGKPMHY